MYHERVFKCDEVFHLWEWDLHIQNRHHPSSYQWSTPWQEWREQWGISDSSTWWDDQGFKDAPLVFTKVDGGEEKELIESEVGVIGTPALSSLIMLVRGAGVRGAGRRHGKHCWQEPHNGCLKQGSIFCSRQHQEGSWLFATPRMKCHTASFHAASQPTQVEAWPEQARWNTSTKRCSTAVHWPVKELHRGQCPRRTVLPLCNPVHAIPLHIISRLQDSQCWKRHDQVLRRPD